MVVERACLAVRAPVAVHRHSAAAGGYNSIDHAISRISATEARACIARLTGALRAPCEALVDESFGQTVNSPPQRRFRQRPVDHIALGMAAAELAENVPRGPQQADRSIIACLANSLKTEHQGPADAGDPIRCFISPSLRHPGKLIGDHSLPPSAQPGRGGMEIVEGRKVCISMSLPRGCYAIPAIAKWTEAKHGRSKMRP